MKTPNTILFSMALILLLLVSGITISQTLLLPTASAQSSNIASSVVINEVDINPPGDDFKKISEWVELYNPTSESIDLSGWKIASTTGIKKTLTLPAGTTINPQQFLTYSYQPIWFSDASETVELRDKTGTVIDKTPRMTDLSNDFSSWQRIYDALDSDSDSDWIFETSSAGSTNGQIETSTESESVSVTITPSKSAYLFGETAVLSGAVSKEVFVEKPAFSSEKIIITISGPDYDKEFTQYPDLNLEFSTRINLQKVLGITEGIYSVTVQYADASNTAQFSVGNSIIKIPDKQTDVLSITSDRTSYIPGQTVVITAATTNEVPFEGLKFSVTDPNSKTIGEGTLFPSSDVNIQGVFGNSVDTTRFITTLFLDTVSPVYGTYRIEGKYSTQTAQSTFEVSSDIREDSIVSLSTDKPAYEPGDTIIISGRSNQHWVSSLSLEVLKSANLALGTNDLGGGTGLKILDTVRLEGDSTFRYEIPLPLTYTSFGEYKVTVSGEIGTFITQFVVLADSQGFVASTEPLSMSTDKEIYELGQTIEITGNIKDQTRTSSFQTQVVDISIKNADDGESLFIFGIPNGGKSVTLHGVRVDSTYTAVPEPSGNFASSIEVRRSLFSTGTYTITASYEKLKAESTVVIVDPFDSANSNVIAFLDKEIYGLNETLNLNGLFSAQTSSSVVITLYKPDGDTDKFGAIIDGGSFSWSWNTPKSEVKSNTINDRSLSSTNLGVYRLNLDAGGSRADIFFKVSDDPQNDSFNLEPLTVSTGQAIYKPGEKLLVSGNVIARQSGTEGLVIPELVSIKVLSNKPPFRPIHEATVYPDQGGFYKSTFEIPATLFVSGTYKVKAIYENRHANTEFTVASDFVFGVSDPAELLLDLGTDTYHPGDTVTLTGKPNKIVYIETFEVNVIKQSDLSLNCGAFYCGNNVTPTAFVRPTPSAGFTYNYEIPNTDSSVGSYEIAVNVGFDTKSVIFEVLLEEPVVGGGDDNATVTNGTDVVITDNVLGENTTLTNNSTNVTADNSIIDGNVTLINNSTNVIVDDNTIDGNTTITNSTATINDGTTVPDISLEEKTSIISMWAGFARESASSAELLQSLNIVSSDDATGVVLPQWTKSTLGKWVIDDVITIDEFERALQYLAETSS